MEHRHCACAPRGHYVRCSFSGVQLRWPHRLEVYVPEASTIAQSCMIKTYGLTHVALAVKDAKRSFEFYRKVFGMIKVYDQNGWIQAQTPGSRDVLVFDENPPSLGYGAAGAPRTGKCGGIAHFGFRLTDPEHIEAAANAVKKAGGKILDKGEFVPGEPYLFCADPEIMGISCRGAVSSRAGRWAVAAPNSSRAGTAAATVLNDALLRRPRL